MGASPRALLRACCILGLGVQHAAGVLVSGGGQQSGKGAHQAVKVKGAHKAVKGATTRLHQEPEAGGKKAVRFMRIHKTGGSIFQDSILERFSGQPTEAIPGRLHDDWSQVTDNGAFRGDLVTLLRDPVERTMSEFIWLRSADGLASATQPDWDFRNSTWLDIVQKEKNVERAFDVFLHGYPSSPTRNRQTLYLLGFRDGKKGKDAYRTEEPGAAYDWETTPGRYTRWAKENLESMTVYGITDCWMPSMRAIARQLGWNVADVESFASASTPSYGKHEISADTTPTRSWRSTLSKQKVRDIENMNKVDMEVFKAAVKRFNQRFGETCSLKSV